MGGSKRTLAEIVDADDIDDIPLLRIRRPRIEPAAYPPSTEPLSQDEITARVNEFNELRLNSLPLNLMTPEFKRYIFWHSNHRLERAKRDGATLADISIGQECLPTWPTHTWDPREESLHHNIQSRLLTHEASGHASILIRQDIIWKSNRKLDEARALAHHVSMALYSNNDDERTSSQESEESREDLSFFGSPDASDAVAQSGSSVTTNALPSDPLGPDTGSGSDTDVDTDSSDSDGFDDQVSVDNYLSDEPYYSEYDEELNVLHGAQIAGLSSFHSRIDLEVFLAEDEDEVEDLPEMQMVVDRDSFEQHFGTAGAVDVELHGARLRCTGELFDHDEVASSFSSEDEDEDMDPLIYE
ncbi:uncharacterized protein NECHADRAFT_86001 [Fusarium vanettenii 77-13-4]|uniref:Uncharacterized protein n=1 Tax=Fusarium vanettenii (strain ATCC MYA-4622 / CBS 123669 / FGSC 9596 / NRRL 45880 / 77-13-4) TaxID=660122 RepID=C7Z226_FUSV7|nr:uncharacterized protein NECHADRAFT_86001 [Fusarium vanettenii 77-13-4]EEU41926.1 hypothetical protein NECHADRAFT_86001 [Fusarium vanettenii 77-13-4]